MTYSQVHVLRHESCYMTLFSKKKCLITVVDYLVMDYAPLSHCHVSTRLPAVTVFSRLTSSPHLLLCRHLNSSVGCRKGPFQCAVSSLGTATGRLGVQRWSIIHLVNLWHEALSVTLEFSVDLITNQLPFQLPSRSLCATVSNAESCEMLTFCHFSMKSILPRKFYFAGQNLIWNLVSSQWMLL